MASAAAANMIGPGELRLAGRDAKGGIPALPLLAFLIVFFVIPLGVVFQQAITDRTIGQALPNTLRALETWKGETAPDNSAYAALASDLRELDGRRQVGVLAQRIGHEVTGGQQLLSRTARRIVRQDEAQADRASFVAIDPIWAQPEIWQVIKDGGSSTTALYLKWATGLLVKYDPSGASENQGYDFPGILRRTLLISIMVTAVTVILGYPVAYVIAENPGRLGKGLLLAVLLPFWTSLLVRSMSWVVLLQGNGEVVEILRWLGLLGAEDQILYSRAATIIAMTQIQLPFTILPMLGVMRSIPRTHVRAARSLGAGPIYAHIAVYMPQAAPGIAAGAMITFILCLGFYITPALVGGVNDQMVSFFVARFINEELNWNLAAALSITLLAVTGLAIVFFIRFFNLRSVLR